MVKVIHAELKHLYPDMSSINDRLFHIVLHSRSGNARLVSYTYPIINSAYKSYINKEHAPKTRQMRVRTLHFCTAIGMSDEDKLIWVLKFGEFLPSKLIDGVLCHT